MNLTYFDAVILGDSLAGRIAAALLARGGGRLLVLRPAQASVPPRWCFSSLLLERILDQLDGRAVLTKPQRFQFLAGPERLDVHGRHPFAEEVRREFPAAAGEILATTADLTSFGEKLAQHLWDSGGLPLQGAAARMRFFARGLRRGLTAGRLYESLADRLGELESTEAANFLAGLLPALALTDGERLSLGEAALLWHGVMRPTSASPTGLYELLARRYQQFHGQEEDLNRFESLQTSARGPLRLQLRGGKQVTAGSLLLADASTSDRLPAPLQAAVAGGSSSIPPISLGDKVSPVLAELLVLAGAPPLRLTLSGPTENRQLLVESSRELAPAEVRQRLQDLFPFATLGDQLGVGLTPAPESEGGLRRAPRRIVAAPNIFACSAAVLPALGSIGEVLTGLSIASVVQQRLKSAPA